VSQEPAQPQTRHNDGAEQDAPQTVGAMEDMKSAWAFVEKFAKDGRGSQKELPRQMSRLGSEMSDQIAPLMPEIAKRAKGEIVLECAAILKLPLSKQIRLALDAKPKISATALRAHLRGLRGDAVLALDDGTGIVGELRKVLTGPISQELPEIERLDSSLYTRAGFLTWFLTTTNPTIVALQGEHITDPNFASALDALAAANVPQAWGWLQHIHIASLDGVGQNLVTLRDLTNNAAAKARLTALTSKFQTKGDDRAASVPAAQSDLREQLGKQHDSDLLEAAARTQRSQGVSDEKVTARLAGESPDVVIEFLDTMGPSTSLERKLALLDGARGSKREHVYHVLRGSLPDDVLAALSNDRVRKQVRRMLGGGVSLRALFSVYDAGELHPKLIGDEALRHWAYEDKSPKNLLWLAAGSAAGAKLGCQLLKRELGVSWVKTIPRDADRLELQRMVLYFPDADTVKWLKTDVLHETEATFSVDHVEKPNASVYGAGAKLRLDIATSPKIDDDEKTPDPDPSLILRRVAEMTTSERHELFKTPAQLTRIFEDIPGHELRAVYLLCPSLPQLLRFPIRNMPHLINYVHTRPPKEELEVANEPATARALFGRVSPFTLLPSLVQPANLASALADNEELLEWILEETEPNFALKILAKDPVREIAAALMQERKQLDEDLPAYDALRKGGQRDFDTIGKSIKDGDAKDEVDAYKDSASFPEDAARQQQLDDRARTVKETAKAGTLWEAVSNISHDPKADIADVLGVVRNAPADQQIALLGGAHAKAVNALRFRVRLGPQHVFPELTIQQLLALPSAAEWLLESEPAFVVLTLLARQPAAIKSFGALLSNHSIAKDFIMALPTGGELTAVERQTLDELYKHVTNLTVLRALFKARFDIKSLEATFDTGETRKLWAVLARLPPAQVNQGVIKGIVEEGDKELGGATGSWSPSDSQLALDDDPKVFGDDKKDDRFERGIMLTAAEVKQYYGLEGDKLKQAADPKQGWLVHENGKYRVKELHPTQHTSTVLHEVGHSIDTLLGEQTELVFGLAGWKQYGIDQFEQWGNDMGAFEGMSAKDREQTSEAWKQALRGGHKVADLVGSDHPALAQKKSPLAKEATKDKPFSHADTSKQPINGRMFMTTKGVLSSVNKKTWDNAPTHYSLTAPAEFFAECYVEYYCGYDGTKQTEHNKGGKLALWIKQWFDENVDKIRLSPDRAKP
jgi:hypothetical protein